jgi:hypothetical protein
LFCETRKDKKSATISNIWGVKKDLQVVETKRGDEMSNIDGKAEVSSVWRKFIRDIFDRRSDPVKHCELYHNEDGKGSCPHVDGMLCDYTCNMLREYRAAKASNTNNSETQP